MYGLFWYLDSPNMLRPASPCARFTTVSSHTMIATIVIQFCFLKRTIFCWSIIHYLEGNWESPPMVPKIVIALKKFVEHICVLKFCQYQLLTRPGEFLGSRRRNWHFKVNRRIFRHWISFILWVIAVACVWHLDSIAKMPLIFSQAISFFLIGI